MLLLVLALVNVFVLRTNSRVNRLYLRGVIYVPAVRTHTGYLLHKDFINKINTRSIIKNNQIFYLYMVYNEH